MRTTGSVEARCRVLLVAPSPATTTMLSSVGNVWAHAVEPGNSKITRKVNAIERALAKHCGMYFILKNSCSSIAILLFPGSLSNLSSAGGKFSRHTHLRRGVQKAEFELEWRLHRAGMRQFT